MMDTVTRMKLQTLRENIVKDLKVGEVFDYLLSRGVLSEDDMQRMKGERTDRDRARHLLDLLAKKNNVAFGHFVDALRKPYPWLSQLLEAEDPESNQVEDGSFLDSLLIGGLPQAPPYNVERKEKLEEVRQHLHSVKRRHYVVLHGMTGCGKSCLAAAALHNKQLVIAQFKGAVYWVSVGDINSESSGDLLSHMIDLMKKLNHHSEVESDRWIQTSISINGATERLRRYFTSDTLREGLLILDDVSSPEIIAAFDVGCKILVTTKDTAVMRSVHGRYHLIKISEGFMEHESLSLMAECVGVEISQLPPQAKKIHQLCKGVPMVIALIGAQLADNKDDVQRNPGRWDYYLEMLERREYGNIRRFSFPQGDGMLGAIGFCIGNLHANINCYYWDLALFVEDVNIKPEVLATLWSRNKYEAEDIMCEFVKKSLAVSKWNECLNCYVYGVHDLLLHYLRLQLSGEEKKELHKKLLDRYKSVSGGKFSNLPNDNYIYFYIGHHLNEAQMWSEFPGLYLDLEFVGAKLKATGPGDLLLDYKKYRRFITRDDEELVAVLQDCEQFVQLRGLDIHEYEDLDIVQCALQEDRNSHVYKQALKIAKERPNKLYMEFLLDQDSLQQPRILSVKEEVFAACFTTEETKILTSNGSGTITLWDTECSSPLRTFQGHKQRIRHLELSPDGSQFLSCSDDATVKLWKLEDVMCENKAEEEFDGDGSTLRTPSPRRRQVSWDNMFFSDMDGDGSYKTFNGHKTSVLYASFCPKGDEVVSSSSDGFVKVWDYKTENVRMTLQVPSAGSFANSCIFTDDSSVILYGGDDKVVYAYGNDTGCSLSSLKTAGCIIAILSIAERKIVVVTDNSVEMWKWEIGVQPCSVVNAHDLHEERLPDLTHNSNKAVEQSHVMHDITREVFESSACAIFTCATVSQDCKYVIVGASDVSIRVWDIDEGKLVKKYRNQNGAVRCLDTYDGSPCQLLLCGSNDKMIKLWCIECAETDQAAKLQQKFDVVWDQNIPDPCIPLLAAVDDSNKLQLLRGRTIVAETVPEKEEVISCMLSNCGRFVVYGCCDGLVKVYEVESKSTSVIIRLGGAVHYLQVCCSSGFTVIAAAKNNSLKMWKRALNERDRVVTCAGQTNVVVQCFLMRKHQKLLSCAQDWSVKVWDMVTGNLDNVLVGRYAGRHVTVTDLSSNEDLLVLCDANGSFGLIFLIMSPDPPYVNVQQEFSYNLDNCIRSCKLSHDAHLLALGQDNGNITMWDVTNERSLGALKLHRSTVQNLLFSPPAPNAKSSLTSTSPVILVSVADQIGWWNVSYLTKGCCIGLRRRRKSVAVPSMSQFAFANELKNCVRMDEPITKGPIPRWQRKCIEASSLSTSLNVSKKKASASFNASLSKTPSKWNVSGEPIATKKTPAKTPKKSPNSTSRTPSSTKGSKTPNGGDRFIPDRGSTNFELGHYKVNQEEPPDDELTSPSQKEIRRIMSENLHGGDVHNMRILSYRTKAPSAPDGFLNPLKVVYSHSKTPGSVKSTSRYIPQTPDRILDAPDIIDDYYLNLIDWSPNNILAVALSSNVYLWNADTGSIQQLLTLEGSDFVCSVSWIQQGHYLAVGTSMGLVQLWDCGAMKRQRVMGGHSARVSSLSWNSYILSSGSRSGRIIHHDVRQGDHLVSELSLHTQEVCGLKWSLDGRYLASGGNDNMLYIWPVAGQAHSQPQPLYSFSAHQAAVKALAWCPWQSGILVSGGGTADRCIRFWNCNTGVCFSTIDTKSQVCALQWSTTYKEFISGHGYANNELVIWKYPSMTKVAELTGHSARVLHLATSPDGSTVLSAGADETLRLWKCFAPDPVKKKKEKGSHAASSFRGIR